MVLGALTSDSRWSTPPGSLAAMKHQNKRNIYTAPPHNREIVAPHSAVSRIPLIPVTRAADPATAKAPCHWVLLTSHGWAEWPRSSVVASSHLMTHWPPTLSLCLLAGRWVKTAPSAARVQRNRCLHKTDTILLPQMPLHYCPCTASIRRSWIAHLNDSVSGAPYLDALYFYSYLQINYMPWWLAYSHPHLHSEDISTVWICH